MDTEPDPLSQLIKADPDIDLLLYNAKEYLAQEKLEQLIAADPDFDLLLTNAQKYLAKKRLSAKAKLGLATTAILSGLTGAVAVHPNFQPILSNAMIETGSLQSLSNVQEGFQTADVNWDTPVDTASPAITAPLEQAVSKEPETGIEEQKPEEKVIEERNKVIEQRTAESLKLIGGEEGLRKLQKKAEPFKEVLNEYTHLQVGPYQARAAFVENIPGMPGYGNIYWFGRGSPEILQAEITRRLNNNPQILNEIKSPKDAEDYLFGERIGVDCAGYVSRVLERIFAKTGQDYYRNVGSNIGNISVTSLMQWAKEKRGGFLELNDNAEEVLNPGTIIVLKNGDLGVHSMIVTEVGILDDGYLFANVAESTDLSEQKKGVHTYTIKFINPQGKLGDQIVLNQFIDMDQLRIDDPSLAQKIEEARRQGEPVRYDRRFEHNYMLIGNISFMN